MEENSIKLCVKNWGKLCKRRDVKRPTWFAFPVEIFFSPKFHHWTKDDIFTFCYIVSMAALENSEEVDVVFDHAIDHGVKKDDILNLLKKTNEINAYGLTRHADVTHTSRTRHADVTHTSRTRHADVTHTSRTRHATLHNITLHNTTVATTATQREEAENEKVLNHELNTKNEDSLSWSFSENHKNVLNTLGEIYEHVPPSLKKCTQSIWEYYEGNLDSFRKDLEDLATAAVGKKIPRSYIAVGLMRKIGALTERKEKNVE